MRMPVQAVMAMSAAVARAAGIGGFFMRTRLGAKLFTIYSSD